MKNVEKTITGNVDPDILEYTVGEDPVLDRALVKWDAAGTAAHVTITPVILPWNEYLEALEGGNFDLWLGETRLTADWDVTTLVGTGGALNYGKFTNADVDAALRTFLSSETPAAAQALCAKLAELSPIQPIAFKSLSVLTPEGLIEGVSPTAAQPLRSLDQWTFHFAE